MRIGVQYIESDKYEFIIWSPFAKSMSLKIIDRTTLIEMEKDEKDYWHAIVSGIKQGTNYFFVIDNNNEKPDPASNYQPDGVHGYSQVVNHSSFKWDDIDWRGIPLKDMIIYELHVGTFTKEGTFDEIIPRLDDVKDLGITMLEIMPIAQFPGSRNWGYDGVYPFAVQNSYGGPVGLKRLVNECHKKKLGVILDVVYNHLGPEGNYASQFGPYFTPKYKTPWGDAVNFDDEYSDHIRNFFIENALYWLRNYHIDALRLDAIHTIFDMSAKHFLQELKEKINQYSVENRREFFLIAESDLNDTRIINPIEKGGYGIDAQWSDDFHHSLQGYLSGEQEGYYADFGDLTDIKDSLKNTFVYSGKYSKYRKRSHGNNPFENPFHQFVICTQNHDQVGNRAFGERLSSLIGFEELKLAAGTMLLTPYLPLLFMGEEYAEESPFLYFVSHSDENLISSIRNGRRNEFKSFKLVKEIPDPQSEETYLKSKLKWERRDQGKNKSLLNFYKKLIVLRKKFRDLINLERRDFEVDILQNIKVIRNHIKSESDNFLILLNYDKQDIKVSVKIPEGEWVKIIDSSDVEWNGPGSLAENILSGCEREIILRKYNFVLYEKKL